MANLQKKSILNNTDDHKYHIFKQPFSYSKVTMKAADNTLKPTSICLLCQLLTDVRWVINFSQKWRNRNRLTEDNSFPARFKARCKLQVNRHRNDDNELLPFFYWDRKVFFFETPSKMLFRSPVSTFFFNSDTTRLRVQSCSVGAKHFWGALKRIWY